MISIIVAMDEKRGIGKDNKVPWHIKEDLVRLRNKTLGRVLVLGRKTYESMDSYYTKSGRQMPGKLYIVITRDPHFTISRKNAVVAYSLEEALRQAQDEALRHPSAMLPSINLRASRIKAQGEQNSGEVFIMGGGQIFRQALEKGLVNKLYLTLVKGDYNADTFFPSYDEFGKIVYEETKESEGYTYTFQDRER